MAKRKPVETDGNRTDAETLRRVREYANKLIQNRGTVGEVVAQEFLSILNGTERKETKR